MEKLVKEISKEISNYSSEQIEFTQYCSGRMKERNVEKSLVMTTLFSKEMYYAQEQLVPHKGVMEKRHKLIFKISSSYSLIIIVAFYPKILKVVNIIKTSKGLEKKWRKKISK